MQNLEGRVYQAALGGDVAALDALLEEDELALDRALLTCFHDTPLHIAIMRGHFRFATTLLGRQPKLSGEFDALHRLPIHLAAIEGHAELVQCLLDISRNSCSVRDQDGRTPLHLAAMKGRVDVMNALIRCCPESIEEKLHRGETGFHLCVRYNQLDALRFLVEASFESNEAFVNVQDDAGNTILHLATFLGHLEIVRYLVSVPKIKADINAVNRKGLTALDLLKCSPRDFKSLEIENILMKATANRSVEEPNIQKNSTETNVVKASWFTRLIQAFKKHVNRQGEWVQERQDSLMTVAILIATISFQVVCSPPGGVWQQTYNGTTEGACNITANEIGTCYAGEAVLAYMFPGAYLLIIVFATVAFIASMSVVLLAISGLPLKNKFCTWLMTVAMILAMTFTTLTYLFRC